jgi:hypothetical protein
VSTPRPDLSQAFKGKGQPPDRAAGLAGLLSAAPAHETSVPPPATASIDEPTADATPTVTLSREVAPAAVAKTRPAGRGQPAALQSAVTNVGVYLPVEVRSRAQEEIRARAITYADLLVESFDQVTDDQLRNEFAPLQPAVTGTMPSRARRRRGQPGIQVQLRLDTEQRAWLNERVAELGAPSRSALVATVFALALLGRTQ